MGQEQHILPAMRSRLDEMFPAERKVAEFILNNPETSVNLNISELAEQSGVSDATVIRMCKRLGYTGYYQMKLILSSELGYIQLMGGNAVNAIGTDVKEILRLLARGMFDLEQKLDDDIINTCVDLIINSEFVYLLAVGNSIPSICDFGFRLGRMGIKNSYSQVVENEMNMLGLGKPGELVIVISHSGSSKQVVRAMELAKSRKMITMLLTHSVRNSAAMLADYCLLTYPEEPLFRDYGVASHLCENAVIDIILHLVSQKQQKILDEGKPNQVEMLLSEFKI